MTTTAAQTKTIAALVEMLKAEGVEIRRCRDRGPAVNETWVSFNCGNETQAWEIADRVVALGYPLTALRSIRHYYNGECSDFFRSMRFSMSDRHDAIHSSCSGSSSSS